MYLFMTREYKDMLTHMVLNYSIHPILQLLFKVLLFQIYFLFLELSIITLSNLEWLDGLEYGRAQLLEVKVSQLVD